MKGKFEAYVMWPLAKRFQTWIVAQSTAWTLRYIEFLFEYRNESENMGRFIYIFANSKGLRK